MGIGDPPSEFFARMTMFIESMGTFDPAALALGIGSLALVLLVPRWLPLVPGSIVALVLGTVAVMAFRLPVDTIGSASRATLPNNRLRSADREQRFRPSWAPST